MVGVDSVVKRLDKERFGDEVARCERCGFVDIVFSRSHRRGVRGTRGKRGQRGGCMMLCIHCINYLESRQSV